MKTETMSGNKYFSLLMTAHVVLSEFLNVIKQFKALVENQCNLKIKALRFDNGGEYTSTSFVEFCNSASIEHQLTLPYTSQQNGISERKNRTIMDMARCLLIEKHMPSQFWAEVGSQYLGLFAKDYPQRPYMTELHMKLGMETNHMYIISKYLGVYVIIKCQSLKEVS